MRDAFRAEPTEGKIMKMPYSAVRSLAVCAVAIGCMAGSVQADTIAWVSATNSVASVVTATQAVDTVWSTTTVVQPATGTNAFGDNAPVKSAFGIASGQLNIKSQAGGQELWVRGYVTGPNYAVLVGFDTSAFSDNQRVNNISVSIKSPQATEADFRWFVEADGNTYVSEVVIAALPTAYTDYSLYATTVVEWFAFDDSVNITNGIGASLGTNSLAAMGFMGADYVGVYSAQTFALAAQAWHGVYVDSFTVSAGSDYAVSWDALSADLDGGGNITALPYSWTATDEAWDTTDEVLASVGAQTAAKVALSGTTSARALYRDDWDRLAVSYNGGVSPLATVIGFDTTSFGDLFWLTNIVITIGEQAASDTTGLRWFIDTGDATYVSQPFASDIGTTQTTYSQNGDTAIEWLAFDGTVNLVDAIGASQGVKTFRGMGFKGVDYVGVYSYHTFSASTWHGTQVKDFSAAAAYVPPNGTVIVIH